MLLNSLFFWKNKAAVKDEISLPLPEKSDIELQECINMRREWFEKGKPLTLQEISDLCNSIKGFSEKIYCALPGSGLYARFKRKRR